MVLVIKGLFWAGAALCLAGWAAPLLLPGKAAAGTGKKGSRSASDFFLLAAAAVGAVLFVLRAVRIGRLPISGGADFLLLFALLVSAAAPFLSGVAAGRGLSSLASLLCLVFYLVVGIFMPGQLTDVSPLSPALVSPLLSVHVFTAAFSYACFALAAGLAALDLIRSKKGNRPAAEADSASDGEAADKLLKALNRIVNAGFFLLTVTIVLGAVWANAAWGAYWSWDPKETWALITWIIYAIYLHQRSGMKKRHAELLLIVGFGLVIFTFFGTNYLLKGLHSYAG